MPRLRHYLLSFLLTLPLLCDVQAKHADEVQPPAAPPKGEVTKYSFNQSKIFPGTVRDYWVYVPKQYDGSKPSCVYVNQDGVQFGAPAVFDELIDKKEIPVVIGVFVTPGKVKAPSDKELDRFNRSYEYDGLGDNYVRFLLEELLPGQVSHIRLGGAQFDTLYAFCGDRIYSRKLNVRAANGFEPPVKPKAPRL